MKAILTVQLFILVAYLVASCWCSSDVPQGPGVAPQLCGTNNTKYYCPLDQLCKPRETRCTIASTCVKENGMEEKCFQSETVEKAYSVYLGHVTSSVENSPEHQFIQYRGFTYEFGPSYGVQILDVNDPDYKYFKNRGINENGILLKGHSYCTWLDTTLFVARWKSDDYELFVRNCDKFATAMQQYLTHGICSQPRIRKRQDRYNFLEYEIDVIFKDCSLVCCYNSTTTSGGSGTKTIAKIIPPLLTIIFVFLGLYKFI